MRRRSILAFAILAVIGGLALLRLSHPLPSLDDRVASRSRPAAMETRLGRTYAGMIAAHPGQTGVVALETGPAAFAVRRLLIDTAEDSIDARYYIWHRDLTGLLLLEALYRAAERGVRVRLLVDDVGTKHLDTDLAAFDRHPNAEVRLFNPRTIRSPAVADYLTDFPRVNRRMHNKSLTVDGLVSVVGGRNIGDAYFGAGAGASFEDLDVLSVGGVTGDVAADFDRYWSSRSAYPALSILPAEAADPPFLADAAAIRESAQGQAFTALADRAAADFRAQAIEWTEVQLVSDDPAKGLSSPAVEDLVISRLAALLGRPQKRIDVINAYFIPGEAGSRLFEDLVRSGVDVRVLTNAQAATDVVFVHAGYARYRERLVRAGVQLFELKPDARWPSLAALAGPVGTSSASLHAKTFAVDGARVFIGSFNFDSRSALINCEMGLMVESPALAARIDRLFDEGLAQGSYRVDLAGDRIVWRESGPEGETVHDTEPRTGLFDRLLVRVIGVLPVEWLL